MKTKPFTVVLAFICGILAVIFFVSEHSTAPQPAPVVVNPNPDVIPRHKSALPEPPLVSSEVPVANETILTNEPRKVVMTSLPPRQAEKIANVPHAPTSPSRKKAAPQDPTARMALSYVGLDESAENYWIQAINDPSLPAEERKDLIEDLNEDGLSNPQLAASSDLPIILNRIQLIQKLLPYTTDPVNLDAFNEAYKDLVNLYNGLPAD